MSRGWQISRLRSVTLTTSWQRRSWRLPMAVRIVIR